MVGVLPRGIRTAVGAVMGALADEHAHLLETAAAIQALGAGAGLEYTLSILERSAQASRGVAANRALAAAAALAKENARLAEADRTRQAWIDATREITTELLTGADPAPLYRIVCERARALTDASCAVLAIPVESEPGQSDVRELVLAEAAGDCANDTVGRRVSLAGTDIGRAYVERRTIRSTSFTDEHAAPARVAGGPALLLPLQTSTSVVAVLVAMRSELGGSFTHEQLEIVTAFADQAAVGLQLATARRRMRTLNVLSDRDQIARDMHDHVIQRLFAVGLTLQSTIPREESPEVQHRLSESVDDLHRVIQEIRTTIFDLHDTDTDTNLRERIDDVVAQFAIPELNIDVVFTGPLSVVGTVLTDHAEAVVREAVSNVVRHAGARTLTIRVRIDGELAIEVCDDGTGIPETVRRSGLANLQARAAELGGIFGVERRSGGGTRLTWSAPLS